MNFFVQKNRGSSLLEVILAIALFGFLCSALVSMSLGGFSSLRQGGEYSEAEAFAQQGIEAVRAIRDSAWNKIIYSNSAVTSTGNAWQFVGENTSSTFGKYTRNISFANVCRDVSNNITTCPGTYTDLNSKLVTVNVSWLSEHSAVNTIEKITYLTNWESRDWTQTDWAGGNGQAVWSLTNKYDSEDGNLDVNTVGEIKLKHLIVVSQQQYDWTFTTTSDFTYNASKILVASGTAMLKDQGGVSGSTTNPSFDSNSNGWTFSDWETANQVSGSRVASGGNPNGYIRVVVNGKKNKTISGYWSQPFVTTADSPIGTVNFSWRIPSYVSTGLTSYYLYAYVEDDNGDPTLANYVWRSPLITSTTNWAAVSNIDIGAKIPTAGTYYLKIVARGIYSNINNPGTTIGAFDNVQLNWNKVTYPTDKPTINPTVVYSGNIDNWSTFTESAIKNGGEIYYQLSSDGAVWKYWNGSAWVVAGASNYNIASMINTNIITFPTSTGKIMFKAFLSSDGSQQVILDNVRVGWGENVESGYVTTGNFLSSAFDMSNVSPVQVLAWDQNIGGCGSCNIKLQLRTAPNNGGSPGVWTGWYGASGVGTYFTNYLGTLLSTTLNGNQWVQYRAELAGDGVGTPILQEVRVNYK